MTDTPTSETRPNERHGIADNPLAAPSTDARGGLFIDSGDGRGPIHIDDMTDAERAAHVVAFNAAAAAGTLSFPDAPTSDAPSPTEDVTDAR